MRRFDLLTAMMRRAYGGAFAILIDCTEPREVSWLMSHAVVEPWMQVPTAGVSPPDYYHWGNAHRAHWFCNPPEDPVVFSEIAPHSGPGGHPERWRDYTRRSKVHAAFWSLLRQLTARGWEPMGGHVGLPDLDLEEYGPRVYEAPVVYHCRRDAQTRSPSGTSDISPRIPLT